MPVGTTPVSTRKPPDYVGMKNVQTPVGLGVTESLRLKKENFRLARLDSTLSYTSKTYSTAITYSRIGAQPEYGAAEDREQIILTNSLKFKDYWKLYGTVNYDLRKRYLNSSTVGISYEDECHDLRHRLQPPRVTPRTIQAVTGQLALD